MWLIVDAVLLFLILSSTTKFSPGSVNPLHVVAYLLAFMIADFAVTVFLLPSIGLWSVLVLFGGFFAIAIWLFYLTPLEALRAFGILAAIKIIVALVTAWATCRLAQGW